jgi:uncharacterized protein (TIGR00252 family)
MTSTSLGKEAEHRVAQCLEKEGHKILAQNWRTRWCEIDLVSQKNRVVYFTEVKFRSSSAQGIGLDYITPKKVAQIRFAAELWMSQENWTGEVFLQGAEVDGQFNITFVEI